MEVESQSEDVCERLADNNVAPPAEGACMEFTDKTPWWAMRGTTGCLDKNRRNHSDP